MTQEAFQHLYYRIANAPIRSYPFPHFFIESAFPDDFYQELISSFPDTSHYQNLSQSGKVGRGTYDKRYILSMKEEELSKLPLSYFFFWQKVNLELNEKGLVSLLMEKFSSSIKQRFGDLMNSLNFWPEAELIRDYQHYSIGPHTDHPVRTITLLFYFPKDDSKSHLGTSLYRPMNPKFTCEGLVHHPFEGFVKVQTMPYLPNSILGFVKTETSFHGVEPIQEGDFERNLMNYYIRWERV